MMDFPTFGVAETTPNIRQPFFALSSSSRARIRLKLRERASMLSKPKIPRSFAIPESQGTSTALRLSGSGVTERLVPGSAKDDTPVVG
jgi:hypothetical protein